MTASKRDREEKYIHPASKFSIAKFSSLMAEMWRITLDVERNREN